MNVCVQMGKMGLGGALGVLALWQNGTWLLDGITTTFAASSGAQQLNHC